MKRRWWILLLVALLSLLLSLLFGSASLDFASVWQCLAGQCQSSLEQTIFFDIRLPRVLAGFLVGAGLAVAGASLQNVTRNGLADPYLFGVVAGAGLGASIVTVLPASGLLDIRAFNAAVALPLAAFAGALLAVLLVQGLALSSFARSSEQLLLAGVAISLMLGSITHFILFVGEPFAANQVMFWMMGSLSRVEMSQVAMMLPVVLISTVVLLLFGRQLDALLLGDDNARTLGVNVGRIRALALVLCAALTAVIVANCGGIGFVGLMIPHIVRQWLGVGSRALMLGCVLCGGSFLLWVDVLARTAVAGQEIPIGIITSALGSLFFLIVMRQRRI
jgi:iron complex transport system permease protein